ncbi:alpha/beta fold hydrolase [Actinomadura miaoliensis]|uniref:Alpha/beta fold hydrolase n=1 Tax=Actinomadura miaoliensis TaxID=430685 RepID=A0ABP7W117_9ACTN
MRRPLALGLALALTGGLALAGSPSAPATTSAASTSDDGLRRRDLHARGGIFVREVLPRRHTGKVPVLLVHGARPGGVATFDLPVPGGSLAGDIARAGHPVYVMDVRGYGRSTYPRSFTQDPSANPPAVRSNEAVRDVDAAVDLVRSRARVPEVAVYGWATGGHWAGMYASLHSEKVSDLVVHNSLYSGTSRWSLQDEYEDPDRPGHPRPMPAWRAVTADSLTARWDQDIPIPDKDQWRDPHVRAAYQREALRADPTSDDRDPPGFRNPTGPLVDAFYLAQGRQFWDASLIDARTLVVRSERDFWSRPEDVTRLMDHLTGAPRTRAVTLPGAIHHVHLDRPARGRSQLLSEVTTFLRS